MANQIQAFAVSHLNMGEYNNFHRSVKKLIEAATPAALHVETQAATYFGRVDTLQTVVRRTIAYQSTEGLQEADRRRDLIVGVIMGVVNAHTNSPIEKRVHAAKMLRPLLATYKGLASHSYSAATSEVWGMLRVLTAEENLPHVEALNLGTEVEALDSANAAMDAALQSRVDEIGRNTPQTEVDSKELRQEIDEVYNEIVLLTNAYALTQPSEVLTQFVNDMNATIAYYCSVLDNQGKSKAPEEETTPAE